MSDVTQHRLKAFLDRNKSRLSNNILDEEDNKPSSMGSLKSTNEDNNRPDLNLAKQSFSNHLPSSEARNAQPKMRKMSENFDDGRKDSIGSNVEFKPVSLFDVIKNTPFDGQTSTANNSMIHPNNSRLNHSEISSINNSPSRFELNQSSAKEQRLLADSIVEDKRQNALCR